MSLVIRSTKRFTVLDVASENNNEATKTKSITAAIATDYSNTIDPPVGKLPILNVVDLLLHQKNNQSNSIRNQLWDALENYGFVILSVSKTSQIGGIITDLAQVVEQQFFPSQTSISLGSEGEQQEENYKQAKDHAHDIKHDHSNDNDDDDGKSQIPILSKKGKLQSTQQHKRSRNLGSLESGFIYVSEKEVPMWKLGYELCDEIREVYRVHAGSPDSQPWPKNHPQARTKWLRAMALCRHICDEALSLTLDYKPKQRPGSGVRSWNAIRSKRQSTTTNNNNNSNDKATNLPYYLQPEHSLPDRSADKSVMYAMHYFNDEPSVQARKSGNVTGTDNVTINVKEHTDPSLFVLEPFLANVEGLQVKPRPNNISGLDHDHTSTTNAGGWISCDGNESPIHDGVRTSTTSGDTDTEPIAMVLFVGRAFAAKSKDICGRSIVPTLHRVIGPNVPSEVSRHAVIYEQKYEEYFS